MLHTTPRHLHRFYTDVSMMSHNDAEGGQSFTVSSQQVSRSAVVIILLHSLSASVFLCAKLTNLAVIVCFDKV